MAAGIGKFGAFVGIFVFPLISAEGGIKGAMLFSSGVAILGVILTNLTFPEPRGKTLETLGGEDTTAHTVAGSDSRSGRPAGAARSLDRA